MEILNLSVSLVNQPNTEFMKAIQENAFALMVFMIILQMNYAENVTILGI